jgi:hypothetical protein
MEDVENTYRARTWFQLRCEDPNTRHLWLKARFLCTFKRTSITALYLFDYNMPHIRQQGFQDLSQRGSWSPKVHNGIRTLFDRIVTRWMPAHLSRNIRTGAFLNDSLTPEALLDVPQTFGNISLRNANI